MKHNQKRWWGQNCACFHNCRFILFNGKFILRSGAVHFVFISVVLNSLAAFFMA